MQPWTGRCFPIALIITPGIWGHQLNPQRARHLAECLQGLSFKSESFEYRLLLGHFLTSWPHFLICIWHIIIMIGGLLRWLSGRESACIAGATENAGSIPGSGRSPGGGHVNPLQYSCLENPMDRGTWQATVHRIAESQTWLKWFSMHLQIRKPTPENSSLIFCSS